MDLEHPEILALRAERAGVPVPEIERRLGAAVGGGVIGPVYY